ncbi:MAG: enoyl-CoA hydratase/isomerase family protein, partial [Kordiimonas sp.]
TVTDLNIPTIAAFNGFAVGFGLEIALAADIRLATSECYFMFPEAKRGLLHTNGVLWLLPRLIGLAASKEMLLSGSKFDSNYALNCGLVNSVYPANELMKNAKLRAKELAGNSNASIELIKENLNRTYSMSLDEMLEAETKGFLSMLQTKDFQEGIVSFLDKRPPNFKTKKRA